MGEQPPPIDVDGPIVQAAVIDDMKLRLALGVERYGTGLKIGNGRSMLRDAYDEALDLATYLRGEMNTRVELVKLLTHVFELHSPVDVRSDGFQACIACDSGLNESAIGDPFPCHTRVDVAQALRLLGVTISADGEANGNS